MTQALPRSQATPGEQPTTPAASQPEREFELKILADKVYDLLKRELQLEYERRGPAKFR